MRIRGAEKWMDGWMDGPLLFQSFQKRIIVIYGKKVAAPGTHIWPRCKLQVYQLSVKVIQKKSTKLSRHVLLGSLVFAP